MAWSATEVSVGEARLLALQNLLIANLASLNTALTQDGLWSASRVITSAMVKIGDVDNVGDWKDNPMLFCIEAGENDQTIRQDTISSTYTNGTVIEFETYLWFYMHPLVFTGDGTYVTLREKVLARVIDWLRDGVLNARTNRLLTLTSHTFNAPGTYDVMRGMLQEVRADWFHKSFGGNERVRGAFCIYRSYIG